MKMKKLRKRVDEIVEKGSPFSDQELDVLIEWATKESDEAGKAEKKKG
jgi:hypothetical protein